MAITNVPGHYVITEDHFIAVYTTKAYKGSVSEAPLIPNLGTK
jgi:hypothetical protein